MFSAQVIFWPPPAVRQVSMTISPTTVSQSPSQADMWWHLNAYIFKNTVQWWHLLSVWWCKHNTKSWNGGLSPPSTPPLFSTGLVVLKVNIWVVLCNSCSFDGNPWSVNTEPVHVCLYWLCNMLPLHMLARFKSSLSLSLSSDITKGLLALNR